MSRYIDYDAIDYRFDRIQDQSPDFIGGVIYANACVHDAPSIDVVRCQDCKHWVYNFNGCSRNPCTEPWYATDFCNYGEREGE